ncbi:helicase-associated domain-containing protein [Rhodococcus sp. T2V]|uniref:helicase-associated domain-containing protein n=1 Tax=Rhodococcus sp. T2V TaxID=3034164 RepID=UPI0023E2A2A5|nr:helicase-associated domain-containing protein [Rhodococcus sp. T2V]MDF3308309.1 helicase-associated domain-containing protein [Rhodococcus sp. T2V]
MNTGDTAPPSATGEHRIRMTEQEAMSNLHTVLNLCAAGELRCSEKTHRPSAATVAAVGSQLAHGDFYLDDPIASFAWPLIIQAGGLATIVSGRLRLTPKGRTALRRPAAESISQLWRRWLTHAVIDEFSRIEQIKGQRAHNVLTSARTRRQTVAAALAVCPPGEWIGIDSLFTAMRRKGMSPNVARSERALWKLYLVDPQYGSLGYDGYHRWEILEGRYTMAVLFEYAGTLGLLDLDYLHPTGARSDFHANWGGDDLDALSRYDGLQAIRLTALGGYTLGLTDTYQPPADNPPPRVLKVLPNLDIVATGTLSPGDQLLLSGYAEHTADRVWALSAASLLAAIDGGRHLADLTTFLAARTDHELPGTLRTVIDDVTRRATQLTDHGHARVIECTDAALAALITRDRALRTLCRPIGDRHFAVPVEHEPKFRRALHKLGYALPAPNTP